MRLSKCLVYLAVVCVLATVTATAKTGPMFPKAPPAYGSYLADGLVLSATSSDPTVTCPTSVGTEYPGVLLFSTPTSATLRQSINLASGATIYERQFVGSSRWKSTNSTTFTSSGTYNFGTIGQTSSSGTYTATINAQDDTSFILNVVLTYSFTSGGITASCSETDQITLLKTN